MATTSDPALIADLQRVAERRILFGHQSVGRNVLEGVARLAREQPAAGLRLASVDQSLGGGPAIADVLVGENTKPESKIAGFDQLMSTAAGEWAEVAFFKFCYIDFNPGTDVPKLFESYQRAHEARQRKHPRTIFVHLTAPLTTVQRGTKGWLKRVAGSEPWGERENIKRNEYNELLRRLYGGKEPLFDLARLEAAGDMGSFRRDGRRYESLAGAYTSDGGHLNGPGQLAVAAPLVAFLAALPAAER